MDVDPPVTSVSSTSSNLKRSSSAPMINVLSGNSPLFRESVSPTSQLLLSIPRTRRFSASFSSSPSSPAAPHSPSSYNLVIPSRVSQLKHEEGMDVMCRETAHEKEVQSKLQMSQSWEDLSIDDASLGEVNKRTRSLTDPLHIFTPPIGLSNSPSPTRTGKQCFSPSMSIPVRPSSFSPSPSPSPTRKSFTTRRSQSPISLRASQFSFKRKCDLDMEQGDFFTASPAKRLHLNCMPSERLSLLPHQLTHSLSSSSLETANSPDQTIPQEASDTADSMSSSSGSPCSSFKPLEPAHEAQDGPCGMEEASA